MLKCPSGSFAPLPLWYLRGGYTLLWARWTNCLNWNKPSRGDDVYFVEFGISFPFKNKQTTKQPWRWFFAAPWKSLREGGRAREGERGREGGAEPSLRGEIMAAPLGRDTLPDHWSYGVCGDGRVFFIK